MMDRIMTAWTDWIHSAGERGELKRERESCQQQHASHHEPEHNRCLIDLMNTQQDEKTEMKKIQTQSVLLYCAPAEFKHPHK